MIDVLIKPEMALAVSIQFCFQEVFAGDLVLPLAMRSFIVESSMINVLSWGWQGLSPLLRRP